MQHTGIFLTFAAAALLSSVSSAPKPCDFGVEIFNCIFRTKFEMYMDYSRYNHFMETEERIDEMCEKFLPYSKCVAEAAADCSSRPKPIMQMFVDDYDVKVEICNKNSDLRREYLKHAKCLNSHKAEYEDACRQATPGIDRLPAKEECNRYAALIKTCTINIDKACGTEALAMAKKVYKPAGRLLATACNIPY